VSANARRADSTPEYGFSDEERLKLDHAAGLIARAGGSSGVHTRSIRNREPVAELMDRVNSNHDALGTPVKHAGGRFPQAAPDYSVKHPTAVVDANLNAPRRPMQAAARRWLDAGHPGCIVNIIVAGGQPFRATSAPPAAPATHGPERGRRGGEEAC